MKQINILGNALYVFKNVGLNLLRAYIWHYLAVGGNRVMTILFGLRLGFYKCSKKLGNT